MPAFEYSNIWHIKWKYNYYKDNYYRMNYLNVIIYQLWSNFMFIRSR